jgi:hypothetical protein
MLAGAVFRQGSPVEAIVEIDEGLVAPRHRLAAQRLDVEDFLRGGEDDDCVNEARAVRREIRPPDPEHG